MHRTLFTMHQTLCEIADKQPVFIMTSIEVPLYLLVTIIEFLSLQKKAQNLNNSV